MAAPSSYTEETLAAFMLAALNKVAASLGWTSLADVQEAVNDTLLAYGVSDISAATDVTKLRALARVAVWQQVVAAVAVAYNFSADGGSYSRSQLQDMALKALAQAQTMAASYDPNYRITTAKIVYKHDPYLPIADEDRTL